MQSRIGLWGGSCAVRIPKMAVESLGLHEGEIVSLSLEKGALVVRPAQPKHTLAKLVAEAEGLRVPPSTDDPPVGDEAL